MQTILLAALCAFAIVLVLGPFTIPALRRLKFGQIERELGPESHKAKQGTPTMGGLMILFAMLTTSLLFGLEGLEFLLPSLLVVTAFSVVGFLDDFLKVKRKHNLGLRAYQKIIAQFGIALVVAIWAYRSPLLGPVLYLPISGGEWNIGIYYIPLVMFTVISEVNAFNLTDGVDGLASGVMLIYSIAMAIIFAILAAAAALFGNTLLNVNYGAMGVFAAATAGGCLGFLCYNSYPARVIMGDTGSLALGGAVSMLAICSRSLLLLPIMGICFVGSALSCVLQVGYFKLTHGKRIFKMAPLHHHFELSGYPEAKIVSMYMLVTTITCAVCLLSYVVIR